MLLRARGLKSLVHDAVDLTLDLIEEGHESVARNATRVLGLLSPGSASAALAVDLYRLTTAPTLDAVRLINRLVARLGDAGIDLALAARTGAGEKGGALPMRSDITGGGAWLADAAIGAANGAFGDFLHLSHNGLDSGFSLRHGDRYLEPGAEALPHLDPPARRLALFIHGLGTTEWSWCWDGAAYHGDAEATFGTLLARDLGATPIYARYNTGRRVCDSGRLLSEALERLYAAAPAPIEEILLIGHSMGGLVARSACHHGHKEGHRWLGAVSRVLCLGSPHQGAPLEKLGHVLTSVLGAVDHPGTRIPAAILRRRSAGIKDLRHGTILDDGEAPLLDSISYHCVSATVTRDQAHPIGRLIGDVLVRVPSAAGPRVERGALRIETECFGGILHHQIQNHPDVYRWLLRSCGG